MLRISDRSVVYFAFSLFCFLSAIRDVVSEGFFKHSADKSNPIFILFTYSIVTQAVAAAVMIIRRGDFAQEWVKVKVQKKNLLLMNFFTLTGFLSYFMAIYSPLGAAINAVVDYGFSPIFTALVGVHLMREALDRRFFLAALTCIIGVIGLSGTRLSIEQMSSIWFLGLVAACISSASSAYFRVYFKILLDSELTPSTIILFRLIGLSLTLAVVLCINPNLFHPDLLMETIAVGLIGFTVPLYLTLTVIRRVTIRNFSILLFLFPALTFVFSAALGYIRVYLFDIFAVLIIFLGVGLHEGSKKTG